MPNETLLPFAVVPMAGFPFAHVASLHSDEVIANTDQIRAVEETRHPVPPQQDVPATRYWASRPRTAGLLALRRCTSSHRTTARLADLRGIGTSPWSGRRVAPTRRPATWMDRCGFNPFELFGFPQRDGTPLLPLADNSHLARLSADRCVLQREIWAVSSEEIPKSSLATIVLDSQRLRHRRGRSKRVFVTRVEKPKPDYMNFNSPLLLRTLSAMARKSPKPLVMQEVFPGRGGLWNETFGHAVTSELRCTAVSSTSNSEGASA